MFICINDIINYAFILVIKKIFFEIYFNFLIFIKVIKSKQQIRLWKTQCFTKN